MSLRKKFRDKVKISSCRKELYNTNEEILQNFPDAFLWPIKMQQEILEILQDLFL